LSAVHVSPAVLEFREAHDIARRRLRAAFEEADWILTGTSTHPEQLSHAIMNLAGRMYDGLKPDPAALDILSRTLGDIAVGIPPTLQCWRCGSAPVETCEGTRTVYTCACPCQKHRLDDEKCFDCSACMEGYR
jgi:hypothetical protein